MRNRSKDTIPVNSDVTYHDVNYLAGTDTPSAYGLMKTGQGEVARMTDWNTPSFRKLASRGIIVNHDMTSESMKLDYPSAPYYVRNRTYDTGGALLGDAGAYTNMPITADEHIGLRFFVNRSDLQRGELLQSIPGPTLPSGEQVLTKAVAQAAETDAMFLVTMAEARKTLDSIQRASDCYHRIWRYIAGLRRSDFTPSGALRHVGNGLKVWLEVRYGLLPTYYDILGYCKMAKKIGKRSRTRFTARAEGEGAPLSQYTENISTFYSDGKSVTYVRRDIIRAGILVEPVAENVEAITSLGIDRIASSAWELVPFSFIVDWFINASDTIAAHEGRFTMRNLATWLTYETRVRSEFNMITAPRDWVDLGPNRRYVGGPYQRNFSASEDYKLVIRKADPAVPLLPSFRLNLNWKKAVDLAAIATTVRNGLK